VTQIFYSIQCIFSPKQQSQRLSTQQTQHTGCTDPDQRPGLILSTITGLLMGGAVLKGYK